MKKASKHYKFINSKTGYAIFYYSLDSGIEADKAKEELEKVKAKVAINNGIYTETIYWEEVKDESVN